MVLVPRPGWREDEDGTGSSTESAGRHEVVGDEAASSQYVRCCEDSFRSTPTREAPGPPEGAPPDAERDPPTEALGSGPSSPTETVLPSIPPSQTRYDRPREQACQSRIVFDTFSDFEVEQFMKEAKEAAMHAKKSGARYIMSACIIADDLANDRSAVRGNS